MVDKVGGRVNVQAEVKSLKERLNNYSRCEEVFSACLKNYVKTNTYKLEDPFAYSVSMKRIT